MENKLIKEIQKEDEKLEENVYLWIETMTKKRPMSKKEFRKTMLELQEKKEK